MSATELISDEGMERSLGECSLMQQCMNVLYVWKKANKVKKSGIRPPNLKKKKLALRDSIRGLMQKPRKIPFGNRTDGRSGDYVSQRLSLDSFWDCRFYVKLWVVGFRLVNFYNIYSYWLITSSGRTRSLFIALLSSRVLPKKLNKKITSLIIY